MDHYAGPARIIKQVGKRSFLIEYRNAKGKSKVFQRDASMLSLLHPARVNFEPEDAVGLILCDVMPCAILITFDVMCAWVRTPAFLTLC